MRYTRSLGFAAALVAAAIVGGTLIGSTLATDEADTDSGSGSESSDRAYCEVFMDTLAGELGLTRESLTAAGQAAANAAIDAALEAGDLSEERAEALRERVAAYDGSGCGWFGRLGAFGKSFHHGFAHGLARGFFVGDVRDAAADALGVASDDLIGALREAGSLQTVAETQDVPYDEVRASILAALQSDLEGAVEEGLDPERADAVIERVTNWLDGGGEVGSHGSGSGAGHRHGPGFGPGWDDEDPDADDDDTGA